MVNRSLLFELELNEYLDTVACQGLCVCVYVCVCVCVSVCVWGEGVKPLVYQQWLLRHVTLVKRVNTIASFRTKQFCSSHKI